MPRPRSSTTKRWGCPRPTSSRSRRIRSRCSRPTNRRWRPSKRSRRSGCCSTTARAPRRPARTTAGDPYPGFEQSFSDVPDPRHEGSDLVPRAGRHAQRTAADRQRRQSTPTPRMRAPLPLTDYRTEHRHGRPVGQRVRSGNGTGRSPRPAPPCPTCRRRSTTNTTAIGGGAVHLWVKSSTPDVDLQATVSEVRPDGNETFVQNGWIRASERKLATNSNNIFKQKPTLLQPIPTMLASDVRADAREPVRAGRRSRCTSRATPTARARASGSRSPRPTERSRSGRSARRSRKAPPRRSRSPSRRSMPSSLILPIVPGVSVPTALPACPSLRNEPCRPYQAYREQRLLTAARADLVRAGGRDLGVCNDARRR